MRQVCWLINWYMSKILGPNPHFVVLTGCWNYNDILFHIADFVCLLVFWGGAWCMFFVSLLMVVHIFEFLLLFWYLRRTKARCSLAWKWRRCTLCSSTAFVCFCQPLYKRSTFLLGIWACHLRVLSTLRAPLSGTFLQTLPDLVTPLKGHSLSPRSCPPLRSAPTERFGY